MAGMVLLAALAGCMPVLSEFLGSAPNSGRFPEGSDDPGPLGLSWLGVDRQLQVPVGPPEAEVRVWVMEPKENPRGTVLVLHGWRNQAFWWRGTARCMTRAGFRAVLVDLRGHGGSSGDRIGFGALESRDLVQVIDRLESEGLVAGRLGVWGFSMGAATAIQLAGRDERIAAVVAVAPYESMRAVIGEDLRLWTAGLWPDEAALDELLARMTHDSGYQPAEADTLAAIRRTRAPVLLVHGTWDLICPHRHSEKLHQAAPDHSRLISLPFAGHLSLHVLNSTTYREAPDWFARHLAVETPGASP